MAFVNPKKVAKTKNASAAVDSGEPLLDMLFNRLYNSKAANTYFDKQQKMYGANIADFMRGGVDDPLNFAKGDPIKVAGTAGGKNGKLKGMEFVGSNAGTTAKVLGANMAAHPFKTAAGGFLAANNVAGLFDDPNIIGQIAGLAGGAAASKFLVPKLTKSPFGIANTALLTLAGGSLGSMFDKLMAKKAEEQQFQNQYH